LSYPNYPHRQTALYIPFSLRDRSLAGPSSITRRWWGVFESFVRVINIEEQHRQAEDWNDETHGYCRLSHSAHSRTILWAKIGLLTNIRAMLSSSDYTRELERGEGTEEGTEGHEVHQRTKRSTRCWLFGFGEARLRNRCRAGVQTGIVGVSCHGSSTSSSIALCQQCLKSGRRGRRNHRRASRISNLYEFHLSTPRKTTNILL
jgi:hypothetical protein